MKTPDDIRALVFLILASYIVTTVVTKGRIFMRPRQWFRRIVGKIPHVRDTFTLTYSHSNRTVLADDPQGSDSAKKGIRGFDVVSCAQCSGAYITAAVILLCGEPLTLKTWLAAWGGAWALFKLEK